jgi:hypothetical protein
MRIFAVIICSIMVLASPYAHASSLEAQRVERIPQVKSSPLESPISPYTVIRQPIPKPRASIHDRNYTASYPKTVISRTSTVSTSTPVQVKAEIDPNTVRRTSIITTTTKTITKRPTTTKEFLSGTVTETVVTPISTEYGINASGYSSGDDKYDPAKHPVYEKAIALPQKEIEEGKYRTFRGIENGIAYDTRKVRGKLAEFIFPEMNDIVEKPQGKLQPQIYCYKSLANSTCYSKPLPGQEFRLVGKPDPRF